MQRHGVEKGGGGSQHFPRHVFTDCLACFRFCTDTSEAFCLTTIGINTNMRIFLHLWAVAVRRKLTAFSLSPAGAIRLAG